MDYFKKNFFSPKIVLPNFFVLFKGQHPKKFPTVLKINIIARNDIQELQNFKLLNFCEKTFFRCYMRLIKRICNKCQNIFWFTLNTN